MGEDPPPISTRPAPFEQTCTLPAVAIGMVKSVHVIASDEVFGVDDAFVVAIYLEPVQQTEMLLLVAKVLAVHVCPWSSEVKIDAAPVHITVLGVTLLWQKAFTFAVA